MCQDWWKALLELTTTHLSTFVALPVEVVDMPFTDVKEEDWFYGAVVYAYQNSILTGTAKPLLSQRHHDPLDAGYGAVAAGGRA